MTLGLTRQDVEAVVVFSLLGDPTRFEILGLCEGNRPVGVLAEGVSVSTTAVSQHLKLLRQAGLIAGRKVAQTIYYKRVPGALEGALAVLARLAEGG